VISYEADPSPRILKEESVRLAQELARRGLLPVGEKPGLRRSARPE
jgi:hypothetical protein